MNCPVCRDEQLVMSDRQGVEIDYCPRCRGVWLDRGELDKIIERANREHSDYSRMEHDREKHHGEHRHYKKKSWWHEIFD